MAAAILGNAQHVVTPEDVQVHVAMPVGVMFDVQLDRARHRDAAGSQQVRGRDHQTIARTPPGRDHVSQHHPQPPRVVPPFRRHHGVLRQADEALSTSARGRDRAYCAEGKNSCSPPTVKLAMAACPASDRIQSMKTCPCSAFTWAWRSGFTRMMP